jgi:Tfp pilus assembly protein PilO
MTTFASIKKVFLFVIILNVIGFAAYGFLFWRIKVKNENVISLVSGAETDLKKEEFLRVAKFSLEENKENVAMLDTYFVDRGGAPNFIEQVEDLGRDAGVFLTIGLVDVEADSANKNDYKELLKLRVEASGKWQNVLTFLSMIENLPYKVSLDQFSLSVDGVRSALFFGNENKETDITWKGYFEFSVLKLK